MKPPRVMRIWPVRPTNDGATKPPRVMRVWPVGPTNIIKWASRVKKARRAYASAAWRRRLHPADTRRDSTGKIARALVGLHLVHREWTPRLYCTRAFCTLISSPSVLIGKQPGRDHAHMYVRISLFQSRNIGSYFIFLCSLQEWKRFKFIVLSNTRCNKNNCFF